MFTANILLHAAAAGAFYCMLAGLDFSRGVRITAAMLFAVVPLYWDANLAAAATLASLACFAHGQRAISVIVAAGAIFLSAGPAVVLPGVVAVLAFLYCSQQRRRDEVWFAAYPYLPIAAASAVWHAPYSLPQRTPAIAIGMVIAAAWILAAMNMDSLRDDLILCGALTALPLLAGNPYLAAAGVSLLAAVLLERLGRLSQFFHLRHPPGDQQRGSQGENA